MDAAEVRPDVFRPARSARERQRRPHPVAAWFGLAALRVFAWLPFPVIYRVAGLLGWLGSFLPIRPVRFAAVTLRICYPGLDDRERARLMRQSLVESARTVCELGALWTWDRDRVLGLVREVVGEAEVQAAFAKGRGVILLGPHLGAWELAGLYCSSRFPFAALYKRPAVTALDRFWADGRTRFGARLVPAAQSGIRTLVRALSESQIVGLMPDQDPRQGAGVFVPFFGTLANTTTLVSRLAQRSGAPVLVGFAERLAAGGGFRLHFRPASPGVYDADVVAAAAALNLDIEQLVRSCPEQYLWSYKRFRVRPPGQTNPYRQTKNVNTIAR